MKFTEILLIITDVLVMVILSFVIFESGQLDICSQCNGTWTGERYINVPQAPGKFLYKCDNGFMAREVIGSNCKDSDGFPIKCQRRTVCEEMIPDE